MFGWGIHVDSGGDKNQNGFFFLNASFWYFLGRTVVVCWGTTGRRWNPPIGPFQRAQWPIGPTEFPDQGRLREELIGIGKQEPNSKKNWKHILCSYAVISSSRDSVLVFCCWCYLCAKKTAAKKLPSPLQNFKGVLGGFRGAVCMSFPISFTVFPSPRTRNEDPQFFSSLQFTSKWAAKKGVQQMRTHCLPASVPPCTPLPFLFISLKLTGRNGRKCPSLHSLGENRKAARVTSHMQKKTDYFFEESLLEAAQGQYFSSWSGEVVAASGKEAQIDGGKYQVVLCCNWKMNRSGWPTVWNPLPDFESNGCHWGEIRPDQSPPPPKPSELVN